MPKLNQQGVVAQILVLIVLAAGLGVALFLSQNPISWLPKASVSAPIGGPFTSGLIGYWKFSEGSGTTSADATGTSKTAALKNSPAWANGIADKALSFNGTSSYASLPLYLQTAGQTKVKNPTTLSFWFNPRVDVRTTKQGLLSSDDGDSCGSLRIESEGKRLYLSQRCYGFPYIDITNDNWTNQWVNLVITVDSTGEKAYINGVQRALIGLGSQNINWVTANLGRRNSARSYLYFNGLIDEVRVYNRVLPASEIQQLYSYTLPTPSPTPKPTSYPSPSPTPKSTTPTPSPSRPADIGISLTPFPLKMTSYTKGISVNPATVTCLISSCAISLYSSTDLPGSGSSYIFGNGRISRGQSVSMGIKTPFADPGVYNTQVTFVNNDTGQKVTIPFEVTVLK